VIRLGQIFLVRPLGGVGRFLLDQVALHPVDMVFRLDPVIAPEQPGQPGMADRDVEMVGVIVGDRLPVERPRPKRHPPHHAQLFEPIGRDLVLVRRHHLVDGRRSGLKRHEEEPAPVLQGDREQPELFRIQPRIFVPVRHAHQPPVAGIAPGVIGASHHLGATAGAIDQPRAAVATDVMEGADLPVVAADHEHALAQIFQAPPLAGLRDFALVAYDLRRRAQERLLLRLEEFRVVV